MGKTYYSPWQNPTYPEDQDMPVAEMERLARAASLARAQSPGPRTCVIDGAWSVDDPFHADNFQTCMQYRHRTVVADSDPWTYWQLVDGPLIGPKPPPPTIPSGLIGWQVRAFAGDVPAGSQIPIVPPPQPGADARVWAVRAPVFDGLAPTVMDGQSSGWNGFTFSVSIGADALNPQVPAFATRVTLIGAFRLDSLYIGQVDPNDPSGLVATNFHRFRFWVDQDDKYIPNDPNYQNPFGQLSNSVIAQRDDSGIFIPVVTEPLPVGFDAANGLIISGYLNANGNGLVGTWASGGINWSAWYDLTTDQFGNYIPGGDTAANIDKSAYSFTGYSSVAVMMIEGLYDPKQVPSGVPTSPG